MEQPLWIGSAAEADCTVNALVLMHACNLAAGHVAVGDHLTSSAKRLVRQREGRVAVFESHHSELAIPRALPQAFSVKDLPHFYR